MWIVDELKAKGFVVGAEVKYVRGERTYRIVNITKEGTVTMRIIQWNKKMGAVYTEPASRFLRSDLELKSGHTSPLIPYSSRS